MIKYIIIFQILFLSLNLMGQERGLYFSKKSYVNEPLPTFNESRDKLPVPILDDHKDWEKLYWKAWEIAFQHLRQPSEKSPFVSNWIDEALSPQIFQWDTHFMVMFGRYAHHIFQFIKSHDNFYCSQHKNGMINRVINEDDGSDHFWGQGPDNARAINPPLFSWAEVETYKVTGDTTRFREVLAPIENYVKWIENNRCGMDTPHKLYWSNGQASGMDNTPRDFGRPEPGDGWDYHSAIDHMGWVDLSSQLVMCYNDMSYICKELGLKDKMKYYKKKAIDISNRINNWLWDEKNGLYYDVKPDGTKTSCISIATFWPMRAGVASKKQCDKLVENLKDPNLFWRNTPIPTLAFNQPNFDKTGCYWKGGVWAPTNYMVVQALNNNGYRDLAREITYRFLKAISSVYDKTGTLWEVYSSEMESPATNASGTAMVKPDFVGWTGLAPISMLIETIIGIELDAKDNCVNWNIVESGRHGIKKLHFNGGVINLEAMPKNKGYEIFYDVTKEIRLTTVVNGKNRKSHNLSGKGRFIIK